MENMGGMNQEQYENSAARFGDILENLQNRGFGMENDINDIAKEEKRYQPIRFYSEEEKKKIDMIESGSNKRYLILLAGYVNDGDTLDFNQWEYVVGRQKAYDYIAEVFMSDELADQGVTFDAFASRIIVESDSGKVKIDGVSVYSFMKKMKIENLIQENSINKDFDIEEWSADIERRSEEEEDN